MSKQRRRAHHPIDTSHALEIILDQFSQADGLIKIFLPTLDATVHADGHKPLLADSATVASGLGASRHMCQGIGEVVKLAPVEQLGSHVVLEPKNLGHLHFDAHGATDVPKEIVARGIDLLRLRNGAVIKPQNDIAVITIIFEIRTGYGNGLVSVMAKNGQ